jgi:hypothetical protein
MATTDARPLTADDRRTPRDLRHTWRVLLALLAPLPLLGMGISYLVDPVPQDGPFSGMVAAAADERGAALLAVWAGLPFLVGLVPATAALAWVCRRQVPLLTSLGVLLTIPGFLAAFALLPAQNVHALVTAADGLDAGTVAALDDAVVEQPWALLATLLFLLGITVGLPVLGVALWRSGTAPRWMAALLIAGTATHIFVPSSAGKGLGLLVGAVGFLGVTLALLRMSDEKFDLPPIGR